MENHYFYDALHNFIFEEAGGGAVRHLADRGYTAKQITESLTFPLPYEKVREALTGYLLECGVLLREKPGTGKEPEKAEFVREYDKYGKPSFRKIAVSNPRSAAAGGPGKWEEMDFTEFLLFCRERMDLVKLPGETERREAEKTIYISCKFGADEREEMLSALLKAEREYVEGILWTKKTMYHLLDRRMFEIAGKLQEKGLPAGKIYFRH